MQPGRCRLRPPQPRQRIPATAPAQKAGPRISLPLQCAPLDAGLAELVDALDLGSSAARREGSSPLPRTIKQLHLATRWCTKPLRSGALLFQIFAPIRWCPLLGCQASIIAEAQDCFHFKELLDSESSPLPPQARLLVATERPGQINGRAVEMHVTGTQAAGHCACPPQV